MQQKKESELSILKGKTAVVTGSTSGIGLRCARAFAGAGAHIVLNGIGGAGRCRKNEVGNRERCIAI
jgi:3-hydroxybutyrate dehydrogenase